MIPAQLEKHFEVVPKEFLKFFFQDEDLKTPTQLFPLIKEVGFILVDKEPIIAEKFLNEAINLSKKIYSKYNPDLYSIYLQKARALIIIKDLDGAYENMNLALINAIQNFPFDSFEVVEVLDAFGKFSLEVEEYGEYEIYCKKIENILLQLEKSSTDPLSSLKILYFKCSILDGLTSYYNHTYTIDQLKSYSNKYESLLSSNLFNIFEKESKLLSNREKFYILFNKIKLKSFFKKEVHTSQIIEIKILIEEMLKEKNLDASLLVNPYIFLITQYAKKEDTEKLENFILSEWVDLIEKISINNSICANSYFLNLIRSLLFKEVFLNKRLSNLLDLTGQNYRKLLELNKNPEKIKKSYLYGELCYLGAIINRDKPKMHPWNLALVALEIFQETLGEKAEKTQKAKNLSEWIIKRHNIQIIENKQ